MSNPNFLDQSVRSRIIEEIKSYENVQRKQKSLKDYEVYTDNAYPYVYNALAAQLSKQTASQMPIVSNLNIAKAVVNKEATIYTDDPNREYTDITDADAQVLADLYAECGFNTYFGKANKYYKLRNQSFLQIVPKEGKIKLRVLHAHNIDVIPDSDDPEQAFAYIVSSFDKANYLRAGQDNANQSIADSDDYKAKGGSYQVWTKEIVFTMDNNGSIRGEILPNPTGLIPFVDIAKDKDFEFFIRIGQALTDFTIEFNVAWSDLMYIARMQGYSVGVLSGDANLKPENMIIGPNRFIFLPKNPSNPDSSMSLDFKSPTPNIEAQLKAIDSMIATFLTTRGLDTKAVSSNNSGNSSYSSALERLIAMIDQFRATKEDFDLFRTVENKVHKIVTAYLSLLSGTEFLDPIYNVSQAIINSQLKVSFHTPEMLQTKAEELDNARKEIDLGIADAASVLSDLEQISIEDAVIRIDEINQRKIDKILSITAEQNVVVNADSQV